MKKTPEVAPPEVPPSYILHDVSEVRGDPVVVFRVVRGLESPADCLRVVKVTPATADALAKLLRE